MNNTNKIYMLEKEIMNLKNTIDQAEKNEKFHFANRLKLIANKKKEQISRWVSNK